MHEKPIKQVVQGILDRDECVVWRGQPIRKYALWSGFPGNTWLTRSLFIFVTVIAIQPFSLPGFYMAQISLPAIIAINSAGSFLAGILMLLLGITLAIGPWYWVLQPRIKSYHNAKDVQYVITNHRAMILFIRQGKIVDQHTKSLSYISDPRVKMLRPNGVGDVIYDAGGAFHPDGGTGYSSHYDIGFEGVANADQIWATLQQAIGKNSGRKKK